MRLSLTSILLSLGFVLQVGCGDSTEGGSTGRTPDDGGVDAAGGGDGGADAAGGAGGQDGGDGGADAAGGGGGQDGGTCKVQGAECADVAECCSGLLCEGDVCTQNAAGVQCKASSEACNTDAECCNGICDDPSGPPGICAELGSCGVAGEPCSPEGVSGGSCCSAACLDPTGSGTPRCQYLGGCRNLDELCSEGSQCCSGLCEQQGTAMDGTPIMRCSNGGSCQPIGDVCFVGASANCCPAGGGSFGCQAASAGIDRCFGGEGACTLPGQECATTDECCKNPYPTIECQPGRDATTTVCCLDNGSTCAFGDVCCCGICAPDSTGTLVCCPEGQNCIPDGGACTADGDCCQGCCDDRTSICTTSDASCGTCDLGRLGDPCSSDAECCNSGTSGPVFCNTTDQFPTCQL